jgi:hypothetical protein
MQQEARPPPPQVGLTAGAPIAPDRSAVGHAGRPPCRTPARTGWGQSRNALVRQDNRGDLESRPSPAADISLRVGLNRPGHHDVDNLVRHFRDRLGRGGNGFQPAIARTQTLAFSLSFNPGKCRRSSTIADSSPLSSNAFRMAAAVDSSTLNMPNSIRDRARPAKSRLTVSRLRRTMRGRQWLCPRARKRPTGAPDDLRCACLGLNKPVTPF